MPANRNPILIYVHIPKTAGTTLRRIIERQYEPSRILTLYDDSVEQTIRRCQNLEEQGEPSVDFIVGHRPFGLHEWLSQPAIYVTMLRDPVERTISYYYHIRRHPDHFAHEEASRMNLAEFVQNGGLGTIENGQTKYMAASNGRYPDIETGEFSGILLERAIKNIQRDFAVVGLVEQFDESLILLRRFFGWRTPLYIRENVGKNRHRKTDLPRETVEIIKAHNTLDLRLYRYAKEMLDERIYTSSSSFRLELKLFKAVNRIYSSSTAAKRKGSKCFQRTLGSVP